MPRTEECQRNRATENNALNVLQATKIFKLNYSSKIINTLLRINIDSRSFIKSCITKENIKNSNTSLLLGM